MKKSIFIVFALVVVVFAGCGEKLREEVVATYDNGQPSKVQYYNKENQMVLEKNYYESGILMMEGPIANNLRNGDWVSYFPDGKVQSTGVFKDGVRVGPSKVYHENGKLWMDGYYIDDHKCGEWIFYDEQGYEVMRQDCGSCD